MVFDRLEIGPVQLEPGRLIVPYSVTQKGKRDSIDLIYRFEEEVFGPDDPSCRNLADMIGAQVALNYGIFSREMTFCGSFDDDDRRFIHEIAANTAREIYVKKFLEPNPFLVGPAAKLAVDRKPNYLHSKLVFKNSRSETYKGGKAAWSTDDKRYAVLSSGGKDSLLSFGLINELGYEAHPIFINESGRHWYTALNSYRHFKKNYPLTSRVWTNADRVFNWMLRHMPFIRQDFANIRSDEYPIRLWTVAVFIFGALPILRKRGIGRLVIGDEHDTTRRMTHKGLPHYDGLYDQSRYFDNAMTRYFARKGWGIKQFSILRQLAEMLIEKVLIERYPDLQLEQVSCHATHISSGRVFPCGRCEKCRRIVGMLLALGADPSRCGYTKNQIKMVLREISNTRLRQDASSARHLMYMLMRKGLISRNSGGGQTAREHQEILKIMLDDSKSPLNVIPRELQHPLFKILLEHAEGVVERRGNNWVEIDAGRFLARMDK